MLLITLLRSTRRQLGILGCGLMLTHFGAAQGVATVSGRVIDGETETSLAYSHIIVLNTSIGTAADTEGRFILRNVPLGPQTLRISYIGYESVTLEVMVIRTVDLEADIRLFPHTITGETVTITAQAQGQITAINQQLALNTIANVVSENRIKELPDVNAAESIGRLPGISIQRSGGEATKVEIRGLSPKYNTVTVNGVLVPATGGDDRSVDLSLISSNMLAGIEVKKANTPDMDADVIGGTVDLKLKEAPEDRQVNVSLQGGYNQLQKYYGNYNLTASLSDRFLEGDLGIMVNANIDHYDRSADKFTGNYRGIGDETGVSGVEVQSILLREESVKRGRTGASILFDYRIPGGKITANSFYNRLRQNSLFRINRMDVDAARHYYDIEDRHGTTSIFTGALGGTQDFGFFRYDFVFARTASRSDNPEDYIWEFAQENNAFDPTPPPGTSAIEIPDYTTPDSTNSGLANIYIRDTRRTENQSSVQLNLEVPFQFGDFISGYIKTGGKLRWLDRLNDENQYGRNGLQYGSGTTLSQPISILLRRLSEMYPDEFDFESDSALVRQYGVLPLSRFQSDYTRLNFLNNEYPLGYTVDEGLMRKVTNALRGTSEWLRYAIQSRGRDYDGIERYQAAYIMSEINLGQYISVLPGIRWEKDYSLYHGQSYRQNVVSNIERDPLDLVELETVRRHEFWLPMIHVRFRPATWLNIRLARTETLTRPDFIRYAPITYINNYSSYINAASSLLKPARARNYDAAFSIYQNYVGLFSVSGFHKSIDDLILQTTIFGVVSDTLLPEGVNVQSKWWDSNIAPQVDTYTNNPSPATYKGFELDWQTHFWYLPSFLQGLILNVNYTRIYSQIDKQLLKIVNGDLIPGTGPGTGRPARYTKVLVDTSRSARMPDQPAYILNVTIGYDLAGFSARLSYLYQTDKTTALSLNPTQDNFTGAYARWDLTLQQHIGWGLQVYSSFTNLNNRSDRNFRGSQLTAPTYTEYYGFAMDVGFRYRF